MKDYLARVAEAVARVEVEELDNAVRILKEVRKNNGVVWIVGNGGSDATAEHFAVDLIKLAHLRAISLPSLSASILAYGNDCGWEMMFSEFLMEACRAGDALVAISCSGNSPNVVEAARIMRQERLIILTGGYESNLALIEAGAKIFVPGVEIRIQEDVHLAVCHAIAGGAA